MNYVGTTLRLGLTIGWRGGWKGLFYLEFAVSSPVVRLDSLEAGEVSRLYILCSHVFSAEIRESGRFEEKVKQLKPEL